MSTEFGPLWEFGKVLVIASTWAAVTIDWGLSTTRVSVAFGALVGFLMILLGLIEYIVRRHGSSEVSPDA